MSASIHQKTLRLTVAQAVVKYLQVQYSELDGLRQRLIPAAFGIYGHGQVAGLGQALFEYGEDLPFYQTRNEQSMVHTAIAYTNMITGAATALINRMPVLLLPADYYVGRHQGPVLQQLEHVISADMSVNDCFRPVSRRFDRISRPEQLLTALPEAMRVLVDPVEAGPATIALPQDVQMHAYDFPQSFFEERTWRIDRRLPSPQRIAEAVELLEKSQRPLIIAGGGGAGYVAGSPGGSLTGGGGGGGPGGGSASGGSPGQGPGSVHAIVMNGNTITYTNPGTITGGVNP